MDLVRLQKNLANLDVVELAKEILLELEDYILELNRIQIEKEGTTSFGGKMTPSYASSTKKRKGQKSGIGSITSHITLHDNEGVAAGIELNLDKDILRFETDISVNGFELDEFLINKYGEWRGLTDKSIEKLQKEFNKIFNARLNAAILK